MSEKDELGWPIRMVDGKRLCFREPCPEDEFRINGFCSNECQDTYDYEEEITRLRSEITALKKAVKAARELKRQFVDIPEALSKSGVVHDERMAVMNFNDALSALDSEGRKAE